MRPFIIFVTATKHLRTDQNQTSCSLYHGASKRLTCNCSLFVIMPALDMARGLTHCCGLSIMTSLPNDGEGKPRFLTSFEKST